MRHEAGVGIGAHNSYGACRWVGADATHSDETVAEEVPVALVSNGISHAVLSRGALPRALSMLQGMQQTLIGFVRGERYCVYSHPQRVH